MRKVLLIFVILNVFYVVDFSQTTSKSLTGSIRSTQAFAEIILRKTEAEADYESLMLDYTEEYPKVKENKFIVELLNKEIDKLSKLNSSQMPKLTAALGRLIVKKVEIEADIKFLLIEYNEKNSEVLRARKKLQIYEKAIAEIMN